MIPDLDVFAAILIGAVIGAVLALIGATVVAAQIPFAATLTTLLPALLIAIVFGLTVVKVRSGAPMEAFDHVVRPQLELRAAE